MKQYIFVLYLCLIFSSVIQAATPLPESQLVWLSPSKDEHGSMPLGNGETGINAWVQDDGTLHFYLARTDAWSGNARLLKLGLLKIHFEPNPFVGKDFKQALDTYNGEMTVQSEDFNLRLWVDANDDLIHIETNDSIQRVITVSNKPWRTKEREVDCSRSPWRSTQFFQSSQRTQECNHPRRSFF